jgi:hypothetical protein
MSGQLDPCMSVKPVAVAGQQGGAYASENGPCTAPQGSAPPPSRAITQVAPAATGSSDGSGDEDLLPVRASERQAIH